MPRTRDTSRLGGSSWDGGVNRKLTMTRMIGCMQWCQRKHMLFSPWFGARDVLFALHCAPNLPLCSAPVPHVPGLAVSRRHSGSVHRDYALGLQVLATLSTTATIGDFLKAPHPQTFLHLWSIDQRSGQGPLACIYTYMRSVWTYMVMSRLPMI